MSAADHPKDPTPEASVSDSAADRTRVAEVFIPPVTFESTGHGDEIAAVCGEVRVVGVSEFHALYNLFSENPKLAPSAIQFSGGNYNGYLEWLHITGKDRREVPESEGEEVSPEELAALLNPES